MYTLGLSSRTLQEVLLLDFYKSFLIFPVCATVYKISI
jgi:hypothetical protein